MQLHACLAREHHTCHACHALHLRLRLVLGLQGRAGKDGSLEGSCVERTASEDAMLQDSHLQPLKAAMFEKKGRSEGWAVYLKGVSKGSRHSQHAAQLQATPGKVFDIY